MQQNAQRHASTNTKSLKAADWVYRTLLLAYPPRFRREYAEPMAQLFRDEAQELLAGGETAVFILFLIRTFFDLIKTAFIEQMEENFNMTVDLTPHSYHETVRELAGDPEQLEQLFQQATKRGETSAFKRAIDDVHQETPHNMLYAAWFHRLQFAAVRAKSLAIEWGWVIPLAILNGLIFWLLSDDQMFTIQVFDQVGARNYMPSIVILAGFITTFFVLTYLAAVSRNSWQRALLFWLIAAGGTGYVLLTYRQLSSRALQEQYLSLMVPHLLLLCVAAVGLFLTINYRDAKSRFAFMTKLLEVVVMSGLFAGAGVLFTGVTVALFAALNIEFPTVVQRLFFAGGGGLIPVVATAVIYNPRVPPADQAFDEGFSKMIALLLRILLPLTLLVLIIYLGFIPFNFREPFENRDVLIIYNVMLFAVNALLVGATPLHLDNLSERLANLLRNGLILVAALAALIGVYALVAISSRTLAGDLTPNRFTFIGWNIVNIGLLVHMLYHQARAKQGQWLPALHNSYRLGTAVYAIWTLLVIFVTPWLFK